MRIGRREYAELYGPTTGDRFRLADTALVCEVERDFTVPGEEAVGGRGGTVRDGMAQDAGAGRRAPDLVITNVVVMDPVLGVIKADLGVRDGRIVAVGKAGGPDVMDRVNHELVIGPGTEIVAGEGLVATPGVVDPCARRVSPARVRAALAGGVTTVIAGGGRGAPAAAMLRAGEALPVNWGVLAVGGASRPGGLREALEAGACGLDVDEARGAAPAAIDCALEVAAEYDVQVALHPDTMNEAGYVEETVAAIRGRTVHAVCGAGRPPDAFRLAAFPNVLPSSCGAGIERGEPGVGRARAGVDVAAAGDVLHDEGVLSMCASVSWAGAAGAGFVRAFQGAHRMREARGPLEGDGRNDNGRILRHLAKLTVNPARTCGIAGQVGSLEPGKLADIVLWPIARFGVRPHMVLKGGAIAWTPSDAWAAATSGTCVTFTSGAAADAGIAARLDGCRRVVPVSGCRELRKMDMLHNDRTPDIAVDPDTDELRIDGIPATAPPVRRAPMSQLYFLT